MIEFLGIYVANSEKHCRWLCNVESFVSVFKGHASACSNVTIPSTVNGNGSIDFLHTGFRGEDASTETGTIHNGLQKRCVVQHANASLRQHFIIDSLQSLWLKWCYVVMPNYNP